LRCRVIKLKNCQARNSKRREVNICENYQNETGKEKNVRKNRKKYLKHLKNIKQNAGKLKFA
jgi:hypothetical protein